MSKNAEVHHLKENSNQQNEQDLSRDRPDGAEKGDSLAATSSDEVSALEKRNTELEGQVKEKEDRYLYLYADFENYKKRAIKERSETLRFAAEPIARELLQVIDNLERALAHMPANTDKTLADGLKMILGQFQAILEKQGIRRIETLQRAFDPNFHEAVAQESSEHPAGTIVKEHNSGYTIHGRLLRPAQVVVSG